MTTTATTVTRTFTLAELADYGITDGIHASDILDDTEVRTVQRPGQWGGWLETRRSTFLADDGHVYSVEYLAGCRPDGTNIVDAGDGLSRTNWCGVVDFDSVDWEEGEHLAAAFPGTVTLPRLERQQVVAVRWGVPAGDADSSDVDGVNAVAALGTIRRFAAHGEMPDGVREELRGLLDLA